MKTVLTAGFTSPASGTAVALGSGECYIRVLFPEGPCWSPPSTNSSPLLPSAPDRPATFTLPTKAARVTDADREYVRRQMSPRPGRPAAYLSALPKTKPILHAILADGAGHLFVIANVAGEPEGSILDVFRDTGEYLGRLHLPRPVTLVPAGALVAHVTKDHLLLVVTDEAKVPYVSRLRLVKPE